MSSPHAFLLLVTHTHTHTHTHQTVGYFHVTPTQDTEESASLGTTTTTEGAEGSWQLASHLAVGIMCLVGGVLLGRRKPVDGRRAGYSAIISPQESAALPVTQTYQIQC